MAFRLTPRGGSKLPHDCQTVVEAEMKAKRQRAKRNDVVRAFEPCGCACFEQSGNPQS